MKLISRTLAFLATAAAIPAGEPPAPAAGTIKLPVRVHLMQSTATPAMHTTLTEADITRIFGKVNTVWAAAGIQFEIESIVTTAAVLPAKEQLLQLSELDKISAMVPRDKLSGDALNVCYIKTAPPNGFYDGRLMVVKDTAALKEVSGGLDEPLPRVTSHEIGHALGLEHRQDSTNLMQSGTTGFSLNPAEIAIARKTAGELLQKAVAEKAAAEKAGAKEEKKCGAP